MQDKAMTRAPAAVSAERIEEIKGYHRTSLKAGPPFPAWHDQRAALLTALDAATARAEKAERKLKQTQAETAEAGKRVDDSVWKLCLQSAAAEAEAARLREEASAYRDRADKVHDQMVNMLHNLKKGMEAPTGSRLEAFLDEWTDLLEGAAPTPPAVATVDEAAIAEATDRALWKSVEIVPESDKGAPPPDWQPPKMTAEQVEAEKARLIRLIKEQHAAEQAPTVAPEGPSEEALMAVSALRWMMAHPQRSAASAEADHAAAVALDALAGRGRA